MSAAADAVVAEQVAAGQALAALLNRVAGALAAQRVDAPTQVFPLAGLGAAARRLLDEVLGEGEVSGLVALPDGRTLQIQEAVTAGLWRLRLEGGADGARTEFLEVGAIPEAVARAALDFTAAAPAIRPAPPGAMNAMPVLAEVAARAASYRPGNATHTINFSLMPVNEVDMDHLQAVLGNGPVLLHSGGYGACRVQATGTRHVWSVQFFNASGAVILDTLEIGEVPAAARAADEDFADSAARLREIIAAYCQ